MIRQLIELGHIVQSGRTTELHSPDLSRVRLETVAGLPGMVLESIGPVRHAVNVPFHDSQVRGHAVLIRTGWDRHWGADAYWESGPFLSEDVIFRLVRSGAKLVGVDFPASEVSERLLVVEHLSNLDALPSHGFRFYAVPLRIVGVSNCPVRAFAEITA
jgi:kynurenine formamidase